MESKLGFEFFIVFSQCGIFAKSFFDTKFAKNSEIAMDNINLNLDIYLVLTEILFWIQIGFNFIFTTKRVSKFVSSFALGLRFETFLPIWIQIRIQIGILWVCLYIY